MTTIWILFLLMELLNLQCIHAHHEYDKVININNRGNNSNECCICGECPCLSLEIALQNFDNSTLINITSVSIELLKQINITNRSLIGIAGSNSTIINCNNTGGLLFISCEGIDIIGIIWHQCGHEDLQGAISLSHSHEISIKNCKFQNSNIYGIGAQSLGKISIIDTEFLYNNRSSSNGGGSGLFIQQIQGMNLELIIMRSLFKYNGVWRSSEGGGMYLMTNDSSSLINISVEDSNFVHNYGSIGGGIYVFANVRDNNLNVVFQLKNTTFMSNSIDSVKGDYNGDAIRCYASGNTFNFTMINSTIHNSIVIRSNSQTLISMDEIKWGSIKGNFSFVAEIYSKLNISFSNMDLMATQVSITVQQNPEYCYLKFDKYNSRNNSYLKIDGKLSGGCKCIITNSQFSNNNIDFPIIDIENILKFSDTVRKYPDASPFIQISNTSISDNRNKDSIVRLAYQLGQSTSQGRVELSFVTFTGNSAAESTLYLHNCQTIINDKMSFINNAAKRGAGMYFTNYSYAILSNNADIEFTRNVAALGGGAIYAVHPPPDYTEPWLLFNSNPRKSVTFINNAATEAGNSIYFNIPTDVTINRQPSSASSIMHIPSQFNYSGKSYRSEIATSPYNLMLSPPAVCLNEQYDDCSHYKVEDVMLGEELTFTAKIVDYFNDSAEATIFLVQANNNYEEYSLTGFSKYKNVLIQKNPLNNITLVGKEVSNHNTTINLKLSSVIGTVSSNVRDIEVLITVLLHPCKTGFEYDNQKQLCACNNIPNLIRCMQNDVRIKKGYWYGDLDGNTVVGVCPISYCDYVSCDISQDYCALKPIQDYQCHSHRTGIACGSCEKNYTLPFDLKDCIPITSCHIWLTVIIFILVIIYWFLALFIILCITRFVNILVITGYAYGIIYFYSILDLFVGNNLVSNTMTNIIDIVSGFANLIPRFLGMLCLFKRLSGIDQQFIHYIHPLAIFLLLFIISRIAKYSTLFTDILGRAGIIRATCLLILLSYTSIASTSLQLLRPLRFTKSQGAHSIFHTYLSPEIKYFTGRHIGYAIFAILCTIAIALGMPIFLLMQPCLKRCEKINFIRITPLLDQFQQCFKPKYHSFASFYMICRLLIFLILGLDMVAYDTRFLMLQVLCFLIAMIHAWFQPYKESKLNSLDQTILLIALMIVSLNVGIPFTSLNRSNIMNDTIVAVLAFLPLILFIGFLLTSTSIAKFVWQKLTCRDANRPRRGNSLRSV